MCMISHFVYRPLSSTRPHCNAVDGPVGLVVAHGVTGYAFFLSGKHYRSCSKVAYRLVSVFLIDIGEEKFQ